MAISYHNSKGSAHRRGSFEMLTLGWNQWTSISLACLKAPPVFNPLCLCLWDGIALIGTPNQ